MSPQPRPAAIPFDPGSGEIPPSLGPLISDPDRPILLLVAPEPDDAAARTAIGLADALGRQGFETALADASLSAPRLHRLLDVPNLEGLVDVFEFGASLGRVATRPDTRRFDFVPAGAYAPDAGEVLRSPRWDRISAEVAEAGSMLLVLVPAAAPGLVELSRRVGRALVIAEERDVQTAVEALSPECQVLGVLRPASAMAPDRLAAQAGERPPPGAATIFDVPRITEPIVFRSQRRRRSRAPLWVVVFLVAAGFGGWFLYTEYFAPSGQGTAMAHQATVVEPPAPERGESIETPVPVSVAVEAHQDLAGAQQRVAMLARAEPDVAFFLAPVAVNEVLFYRLLAGPVTDREAGMRLMERLVRAGHKTSIDAWAVRPTTYAFHLGEFDTVDLATARIQALAALHVPSYAIPIRYEGGQRRFRVYGGAYENQAEASVMRRILEDAGLEARLVPRTGEPSA